MSKLSAISNQLAAQAREHSLDFGDLGSQGFVVRLAQESQIMSEQKVIFKLARRTCGNVQEASELSVAGPAATLSDIGRDGRCAAPHLARQPVEFVLREACRNFVNRQGQLMRLLPYHEI